jgi:hypothetical protein
VVVALGSPVDRSSTGDAGLPLSDDEWGLLVVLRLFGPTTTEMASVARAALVTVIDQRIWHVR